MSLLTVYSGPMAPKKDQANLPLIVHGLELEVKSIGKKVDELGPQVQKIREDQATERGANTAGKDHKNLLLGLLGTTVLTLFGVVAGSVYIFSQLGGLREAVDGQREDISRLEGYHLAAELESPLPDDSASLGAALQKKYEAAEHGQTERVPLEPEVIAASAKDLIQRSWPTEDLSNSAWRTITSLAAYRTHSASVTQSMSGRRELSGSASDMWQVSSRRDSTVRIWAATDRVAAVMAAHLEEIGNPVNEDKKVGPPLLFVTGPGTLILDESWLKNVVVIDVTVIYRGGPVRLQNVKFVNCKFELERSDQVEKFVQATLEDGPTQFTTS